jgi:3-hydroxyacyl-[acyl-carrier-protein] dehydratase
MALKAEAAGSKRGEGMPLIAKIGDVRFRNPVYPGDSTVVEVKQKDALGGFTMLSGTVKKADGTRVLTVEFAVAWKVPEGLRSTS